MSRLWRGCCGHTGTEQSYHGESPWPPQCHVLMPGWGKPQGKPCPWAGTEIQLLPKVSEPRLMLAPKFMGRHDQTKPPRGPQPQQPPISAPHTPRWLGTAPHHPRIPSGVSTAPTLHSSRLHRIHLPFQEVGTWTRSSASEMGVTPLRAPVAAPPAISCPGFFHTWNFLRVPPLGLLRRSREPHTRSKIYSNESLMTLEGNRQAQEGLQRFSFKTKRFFSSPSLENKLGQKGAGAHRVQQWKHLGPPHLLWEPGCCTSGMLAEPSPIQAWSPGAG